MPSGISRRKALAAGVASTGMLWGAISPQKAHALPTLGPDTALVRDLKPGSTPIRMGGGFNVLKDKSLTESVIEMKKRGYSGFVTDADRWLSAKDSEIRELRAALKSGKLLRFPGAFSPLVAMAIERHGFEGSGLQHLIGPHHGRGLDPVGREHGRGHGRPGGIQEAKVEPVLFLDAARDP